MLIYKIISKNSDLIYVGKTIQTLKQRLWGHRSDYKAWLAGTSIKYCSSYKVLECGDYSIVLIEETDREGYWIQKLGGCNERTFDHDHAAYNRAYRAANKEALIEKQREKIPCPNCGAVVNRSRIARHKRTKICQKLANND